MLNLTDELQKTAVRFARLLSAISQAYQQASLAASPSIHSALNGTGAAHSSESRFPFNVATFDRLEEAETIIHTAALACGVNDTKLTPWQTARALTRYAPRLATLSDARLWQKDLAHCLQLLEQVSGQSELTRLAKSGQLVAWSPAKLAVLMTAITGQTVKPIDITHARQTGKVAVILGRVNVSQLVNYFLTKKRKTKLKRLNSNK